MTGRKSPTHRRTQPVLEALEGRRLMNARIIAKNGKPINDKDLAHFQFAKADKALGITLKDRQLNYTTPGGEKVQLTLLGSGSLAGTSIRPDGALNLVYAGTTSTSKIIGHVFGGSGHAQLATMRPAAVAVNSPSATGTTPINVVNLKKFDLIDGGYINIEGGVGTLALASAGMNTQIHIAALPTSSSSGSSTTTVNNTANNGTATGVTGNNVPGVVLVSPTGSGVTVQNGVGQPVPGTITTGGVTTIIPTASTTTSVPNSVASLPPGSAISIPRINGAPRTTPIGDPQIFGFDPVAGALVRFDAITGAALQTIPVPGGGTSIAGVGLGRNNGRQVALVGVGSTIFAFDVVTGAPVGRFSTASLSANGLNRVDGIGSSDTRTFVSDASAGVNGLIQGIDVTASLASGQAVAQGAPFSPLREFQISGGLTGLAGSASLYTTGAAHFDTFTPERFQVGILTFAPTTPSNPTSSERETARNAIPNPLTGGGFIDAGLSGQAQANPVAALGSIGTSLALVSGVANGQNVVTLLNPSTAASIGVVNLNDPNRLAGLSESFHPELLNGVLVQITGNLRQFASDDATGLVLTSTAAINLASIHSATDTAVVGRPLNHVAIPRRRNVVLLSSARGPRGGSTRDGVMVENTLRAASELTLP